MLFLTHRHRASLHPCRPPVHACVRRTIRKNIWTQPHTAKGAALHTPPETDPGGKTLLQAQGMALSWFRGLLRKKGLRGQGSGSPFSNCCNAVSRRGKWNCVCGVSEYRT